MICNERGVGIACSPGALEEQALPGGVTLTPYFGFKSLTPLPKTLASHSNTLTHHPGGLGHHPKVLGHHPVTLTPHR